MRCGKVLWNAGRLSWTGKTDGTKRSQLSNISIARSPVKGFSQKPLWELVWEMIVPSHSYQSTIRKREAAKRKQKGYRRRWVVERCTWFIRGNIPVSSNKTGLDCSPRKKWNRVEVPTWDFNTILGRGNCTQIIKENKIFLNNFSLIFYSSLFTMFLFIVFLGKLYIFFERHREGI